VGSDHSSVKLLLNPKRRHQQGYDGDGSRKAVMPIPPFFARLQRIKREM
jgi:hypothetical protein